MNFQLLSLILLTLLSLSPDALSLQRVSNSEDDLPNSSTSVAELKAAFEHWSVVANLERMLEQLRRGGVKIEKVEDYDYGRWAWIMDPEGNRIELWEPRRK